MSANVHVAALSDVGCVRTNNEDAFATDPTLGLYVVCDGMGGRAAGEIAAALACKTVIASFAGQLAGQLPAAALDAAIHASNAAVWNAADETGQQGMGTTLVVAVIRGNKLLVGNVGDSRAYLLRKGVCTQITTDHSYINELLRTGSIQPEDRLSPEIQRLENVITRAIGAAAEVEPDIYPADLKPGDVILLVSDGLTRYLDEPDIVALVDPAKLEVSCAKLIAAANEAGGVDNITTMLLRYEEPTTLDAHSIYA